MAKTKKILIIDDDPMFVKVIEEELIAHRPYKVLTATDGEKGLAMVFKEKPDLVLLDLKLPKLDGLDLLKRLRASKEVATVAVLIITQLSDLAKIAEGAALGIRGYIVKADFSLESVIEKIDELLTAS